MRRPNKLLSLAVFLSGLILGSTVEAAESNKNVILSATSTQDSGLLDILVPLFEKQTGYSVKTVSVGTGQALALAAKGMPTWPWFMRRVWRKSMSRMGNRSIGVW